MFHFRPMTSPGEGEDELTNLYICSRIIRFLDTNRKTKNMTKLMSKPKTKGPINLPQGFEKFVT